MEAKSYKKYAVNKRMVYFVGFLFVAIPIAVGVLVWHFMPKCDENKNIIGDSGGNQGDKISSSTGSALTTVVPTPVTTLSLTEPWKNLRLSRDVLPIHYDITLYPDFYGNQSSFYGNETIEIMVHRTTSYILIHYLYLNMTKTMLKDSNNKEIKIKPLRNYEENQFWIIETESPLKAGITVFLDLQFDGSLTRAIVGFYKSSYVNSITNLTRYMVSSKFEPVSARRAFPCFDEPNIKANFTVHLVHKNEYIALSNMPDENTAPWSEDNSLMKTDFKVSVKMSTYLVCFIVCDFDHLENTTKHGVKVRTYATPDRVNQTKFALDIAVHTMELYQDLFGVPYPLPKQDMIGIPNFVSGAMEHWGLITYREVNMLYDPNEASSANLQRVAVVIAHEISHQWFGNIVTMDWWDDLWLNEGFASFIEYIGADSFRPSWDMMEQFTTEDALPVMTTDSKVSSHPIIVNVQNPNQINEVFDSISYSKGSSVIRMLESVMGRERFFEGVGKYLKGFEWSNAKTDDLWAKLGNVEPNLTVKAMMDTWTRQMGFPYINITITSTGSKTTVKAVQKRFLADINTIYDENESDYRYRWYVFLDYVTSDGHSGNVWMNREDEKTFDVPANLTNGWIKFNVNQTGFYRVLYPDNIWKSIANQLEMNPSIMRDVEKSGLINDAFNLARGGYLSYDLALGLTRFLNKERGHLPWESAYSVLSYITHMFELGGDYSNMRIYILRKVKPVMDAIGWQDTGNHLQKLMRSNIIELACRLSDQHCLRNATEKFRNWIEHGASVPPNLRSLVYNYGIQGSDSEEDWNFMWDKYTRETVPQEQIKLLYGLSRTRSVWLLRRYLEYAKDESKVKAQDFFNVITYISRNPIGRSLAWDWVRSNWEYLVQRFTVFSRSLGRLIPSIIIYFNTEFHLKEVEAFFKQYPDAGAGERAREQALESIRGNIAWMSNYQDIISKWLCQELKNCV
ncbi:glutamyl aminopeptidase-like [Mytilus galloprovincialis]|uniref:glutamyl aminopeptidase-like n=1 Tax=Mytilus galloprovincialis TaxID=29158 RepID=UPI003F7C4DA1